MILKILVLAVIVVKLNGQNTQAHTEDSELQGNNDGNEPCGNGGICVPHHLCPDDPNTINRLEVRFNADTCDDLHQVCCGQASTPVTKYKLGCGYRHINGVGGAHMPGAGEGEAEYGEFPWTVIIMQEQQVNGETLSVYLCGGSLIHPSVLLTAAHCVHGKNASELVIRAGEWDTTTADEIYSHADRKVESIKIHNIYRTGPLYNDVALLFLVEPLELAPNINTVCLPPKNTVFSKDLTCYVSGWGKNIFGQGGRYQRIMKRVELPFIPRPKCETILRTTRLGYRFVLHNSFVCAGGEIGEDACVGDGGGPMVCPMDPDSTDRYYQAGIVTWGVGCGEKNTPGVYAKVSLFRNWIDMQFDARRLDKKFYTA